MDEKLFALLSKAYIAMANHLCAQYGVEADFKVSLVGEQPGEEQQEDIAS